MVRLAIPALRDRGPDVLLLADHFLALHAQRYGRTGLQLSAAARSALLRHRWPGNVRELRNVMEQAVLMSSGEVIEPADLDWVPLTALATTPPAAGTGTGSDGLSLEQIEREALLRALESAQWNVSQAARALGVSRDTLRYRIEKYGLSTPS